MDHAPNQRRIRLWRQKAEECRTVGDQMADPRSRASLYQMADGYDRLAHAWERRAKPHDGLAKPTAG